jgi:hypothetical protein
MRGLSLTGWAAVGELVATFPRSVPLFLLILSRSPNLELEPCSVGGIAHRLEWKAESLYYHVNAFRNAGLVRQEGEGPRQKTQLHQVTASLSAG